MTDELHRWLDGRTRDELQDIVLGLVASVPGTGERLRLSMLDETQDDAGLMAEVNAVLAPRLRFYDYRQANRYADEAQDLVQLLRDSAESADADFIRVIERALTLTVRTALRSDTSSGAQGMQVEDLLGAHATAVAAAAPSLTTKEKRRIGEWIYKFRYDGKQDYFDPDIVAYAEALGPDVVEAYRKRILATDLGDYGTYPLVRLAILDRDVDAIVEASGGKPTHAAVAMRLVQALDEAGLADAALEYAEFGLTLQWFHQTGPLASYVVERYLADGRPEAAMELRWSRLRAHPSYTTFDELRRAASSLGLWESERDDAEAVLRSGSPADYLRLLVEGRRTDEAWALANEEPDAASRAGVWEQLCAVRAETHPAETLPVYRDLVWSWLETAHRSNYQGAAELMKAMRAAARRAGDNDGYERFLDEVVEKNRRRPACMEIFARHGLLT